MAEQLESLIPEPEQQEQDTEVEDCAEEIVGTAEGAFDLLLERREAAFAAAIEPLDAERASLLEEHASIGEAAQSLETLLPARARQAQREFDVLTLAGKPAKAALKLEEMREAERAPEAMRQRQREIAIRCEAIEGEKKAIAKRIFESWYSALQSVIRAAEHGLFIELLNKALDEMYGYQDFHGLQGTLARPYDFLVKDFHIANLTAPERSPEWQAGQRWYRGRR